MIRSEPVERYIVYRTNQNTDMHLINAKIHEVRNDRSYILSGTISKSPRTIMGGHIIFEISENGAHIECTAFEPNKRFQAHYQAN